jgi:ABC-type nitrate/sulfonate/bicarbonate transport system permease component
MTAGRQPAERSERALTAAIQAGLFVVVLAALWALWEGFKWFGEATDLRLGTFEVNDRTLPHVHDIIGTLFEPSRRNGPLLIDVLIDAALFTAKEAAAGFILGAVFGFCIAVVLAHSRLLQRGFLPYIVSSRSRPWSSSGRTPSCRRASATGAPSRSSPPSSPSSRSRSTRCGACIPPIRARSS